MNRIANEILHIASELLPRIKATFTRNSEKEERDYNALHFDIQRFVSTLRKNEDMECFVSRRDDDDVVEITVGFTDHEAMKGIVESMEEMFKKLAKKSGVKVSVEIVGKN